MSTEKEEERIRELFEQERLADERMTPGFRNVLAARSQTTTEWRMLARPVGLAAAVTVLLIVSGLFLSERSGTPGPVTTESASYLYWESPTQLYLSAPGQESLEAVLESTASGDETRSQQ